MVKGPERAIVDECRKKLPKPARRSRPDGSVTATGLSVDLYQFKDTANADIKLGHFFQTTHRSRFAHDPVNGITLKGAVKGTECKFWIHDVNNEVELKAMINRSFKLKHHAILKPLLSNKNEGLSKFITACSVYNETLTEWISKQQGNAQGDYLSDQQKDIIMPLRKCGTKAVPVMQYLCSSYVMVSMRIKIIPFVIRGVRAGDVKMTLRTQLANLLRVNFSPLWQNDEFNEFISMVEHPNASSELILGHPVLLGPVERQAMYRPMCSTRLTKAQCAILNKKVPVMFNWNQLAKSDEILKSILDQNNFSQDGAGACHLGRVASCHYTQHMRNKDELWYEKLKEDTVDKWLKTNLPLVLCRRYALMCDPEFTEEEEDEDEEEDGEEQA